MSGPGSCFHVARPFGLWEKKRPFEVKQLLAKGSDLRLGGFFESEMDGRPPMGGKMGL